MSLFETPQPDPTLAKLEDFVGEGKKYASTDAAARALVEKDNFIARLQAENAEMRKTIPSQDRSQEILDRLEALRTPTAIEPEPQVIERVVEHTGITTEDVEKLLEAREANRRKIANVEAVKAKMLETYGPNYGDTLKNVAGQMGVTPEYLENVAATSPQAFLRLVGTNREAPGFTPPDSSRPQDYQPSAGGAKKLSYYKELQKKDKAAYFSPAVQNQMYKDAVALKEAFYDISG